MFGDFIEEDEAWRAHAARASASIAAWNAAGGRIDLPALGIHGNTHMMMMDTNSDDVLRGVLDWLDRCEGMRVA